ncbi:MAG: family 3 adenylate cyclase [Spirulinaceae cyanobacterium RM2_2_10]|nr:family 3 adenylate cyclase [Spirulinaceae cyanobacterium RM2_2_10]
MAGAFGSAVSATVGLLNLHYAFGVPWLGSERLWLEWWIGNATGILTLTPLLLMLQPRWPHWPLRQWLEGLLWLGLLLVVSWLVFISPTPLLLAYLPFPLAIWAAFRFGRASVALTVLVITSAATWGLLNGRGPFANGLGGDASFISLQAYICTFALTSLTLAAVVAEREAIAESLSQEKEKSERLLLNVLPAPVAERLKQGPATIADNFSETTVLFADIVDFTRLSERLSPTELVILLNDIFSEFDSLADCHGLEKIKTIGDAYMVVGGLPEPRPDHARAVAEMALDMQAVIAQFTDSEQQPLRLRLGMHSGPAIAGVIGRRKFIYDLWGDTVNTASRMESHGLVGAIQATHASYKHLYRDYDWQRRGLVRIKGKGYMQTYLLLGRKSLSPPPRLPKTSSLSVAP